MKLIIVTAAILLTSSTVYAADAVVYNEPASAPIIDAFSWTGGYIGAQAGYAWGKSPFRNSIGKYVEGTDYDPDGFLGGLYAGYNNQFSNNVVLGIDTDLNFANIKSSGKDYVDYSDGYIYYSVKASSKMKWNGAVRARLGYAYDRVLPYIAGGVSFGEYKFDLRRNSGDFIFSEKSTMAGWNIGAGVEYAATDNLILRAEYRYTDFGSKTFHDLWYSDTAKVKLKTHDVRIGVAYKF